MLRFTGTLRTLHLDKTGALPRDFAMNANARHPSGPTLFGTNQAAIAALFWLLTYSTLSLWSELRLDRDFGLWSGHRMLATLVGALAFWLVLTKLDQMRARSLPNPLIVVSAVVPASLLVLLAMMLTHHLWPNQEIRLNDNVRWVIVWAGYFGTGIGLYLAYEMYRNLQSTPGAKREQERPAQPLSFPVRPADSNHRAPVRADTLEWVVDAIADELAGAPASDRRALVTRLTTKAGYKIADDRFASSHNARIDLMERVLRRLGEGGEASRRRFDA